MLLPPSLDEVIDINHPVRIVGGMSTPDHNTIHRFRGERLKEVLAQVFSQVLMVLVDHGLVNIKEVYLDGTKIEANASRYSFV